MEGIFDKTSYLPYLGNDYQSLFYQGLLFNACLKDPKFGSTESDMCRVWTEDNQNFVIALNKWFIRSDGTPVTADDLYFTYNDIIRNNKRNIPWLSLYKDIVILKDTENKIKITFPTPSRDNIFLFGYYVLPQHVLQDYDLENYKTVFGVRPVYTNCANVVTDSSDQYSLIFNLANCTDTNLNFYQIKNTVSFDNFKKASSSSKDSIIDAYIWSETLAWYTNTPLNTNKVVTVFFNTNSHILRVRTRRVLWWLVKHNFYTTGYEQFMNKNTNWLFDVFQSTWSNVKDLLSRDYSDGSITKEDLLDINVQALPASLSIKTEGQKLVYFVESGTQFPIHLTLPVAYDRVSLEYKGKTSTPAYNKSQKTVDFTISAANKNFWKDLNKYTLYGYLKKQKIVIGSLDIYNMLSQVSTQEEEVLSGQTLQLTVIYYDSPLYNFVAERMQNIFKQFAIAEHFVFEKISTPEELQWRLFAWDYDIIISVVDVWPKKDFTQFFGTDKSELNPSQYQNQKMTSLLYDYMNSNSTRQLYEINAMYSKDMPFVILWNVFTKLNVKPHIAEKFFVTWAAIDEANWRSLIYKNMQLVTNIHIDGKRVRSWSNFMNFLQKNLK